MDPAKAEVASAVRRTVGLATLRRLHRMIGEERDAARRDAGIALRIGAACAIAAACALALLALR